MTTFGWALRRIVEPAIEPVTLAEAKSQCQIDDDLTQHDADLMRYIKAAREAAEAYCKRTWVESSWRMTAMDFGVTCNLIDQHIELQMGPIIQVNSVTYLDNDGTRIVFPAENYQLLNDSEPALLVPAYSLIWPSGRVYPGAVQIEYIAGYMSAGSPADAANVPELARQAILMLVAHWFNNREAVSTGQLGEIPYAFERALDPLRIYP